MKKLIIIFGFLVISSVVGGYFYTNTTPRVVPSSASQKTSPTPEARVLSQQTAGEPTSLRIPKISVEADIESVGLDSNGNMDVPKKAQNVGWYNLGVKPGQKGNTVMAGHLDTVTGAPAVFYNLSTLKVGDSLTAVNDDGKEYEYRVSKINIYKTEEFPLQEVFGATEKSRLNLITCSGRFDQNSDNYSHRTVVYSELVK